MNRRDMLKWLAALLPAGASARIEPRPTPEDMVVVQLDHDVSEGEASVWHHGEARSEPWSLQTGDYPATNPIKAGR